MLNTNSKSSQRALFIQATDPAAYPPLINASNLMADQGWEVTFLSAPYKDHSLKMPLHSRISVSSINIRPSYKMSKASYVEYTIAAMRLARRFQPDIVYASDPLSALPA